LRRSCLLSNNSTIEGATHGFAPCRTCAADPNANGNSVQNLFDYVAEWAR